MKKYLITATMVVAVSGTFVSCHDDEITGSTVEQKIQAFEDIFTRAFGKPDPNHTWGFGSPIVLEGEEALTRSINVNGNLWKDCPAVGSTEEADVLAYLSTLQNKEKNPVRLQNYFVTQIHKGDETYNNKDGGYVGTGSDKMNNLHIAMSDGLTISNKGILSAEGPTAWDHINNFNAGTCNDWGAGDKDGEGNTLVLNGGTFDFAYQGADDSKYHNRWCSIDGANVPKTGGGNYAGYYYICFDFEQDVDGKTAAYFRDENNQPHNIEIPGAYANVAEATGQVFTYNGKEYVFGESANCSEWRIDNVINGNMIVTPNSSYKDWIIRLVKAERDGDIPPVKILTESTTTDGYVARKIVTGEQVMKSGRVFCEDIVAAQYDFEDLDYNDVVFDAAIVHKYRKLISTYYDKDNKLIQSTPENPNPKIEYGNFGIDGQADGYSEYYAKVCLLAAGGTLPISIQIGKNNDILYNGEVHNILGSKSTSIMINTLSKDERKRVNMATVDYSPAVDLKREIDKVETDKFDGITDIKNDIKLDVQYGNVAATIESEYYGGNEDVVASAKFMVPLGTPWAKERTNISFAYPDFKNWVEDSSVKFWENPSNDKNNFYDFEGTKVVGLDPSVYAEGKIIGTETETDLGEEANTSSSSTLDTTPATNTVMGTPVGTKIYDFTTTSGPGYLYVGNQVAAASYNTPITAGSKIRVYGVSIDGWNVTLNNQTKSLSNASDYTTKGYVEFDVTSNLPATALFFTGLNFTVTYITIVDGGNITSQEKEINPAVDIVNTGNRILISKDEFSNTKAGSVLRIYGQRLNASLGSWQLQIATQWKQDTPIPFSNSSINSTNITSSDFNIGDSEGCIELTFTDETVTTIINNNGLLITGSNFKLAKVTLEK